MINQTIEIFIKKLQDVTDEETIRKHTTDVYQALEALNKDASFNRTQTALRKAIEAAFPSSTQYKDGYYFTTAGKGKSERYEHLALWYATSNKDRWNIVGDIARKDYFDNLKSFPDSTEANKPVNLEEISIESLELDSESQDIVQDALKHSGLKLSEFIKRACQIHAKTVVGKAKQVESIDISSISTAELLNNKSRKTQPGRVEELSRRAMLAIMHHNDYVATEKSQKWFVSASAIKRLIGSKMELIKLMVEKQLDEINNHNKKHGLREWDNRGKNREINQDINLMNFSEDTGSIKIELETYNNAKAVKNEDKESVTSKQPKSKVIMMPLASTTLEIHEKLKENPDFRVRIRDGNKALTYLIKGENVELEETGELEKLLA